MELTAYGRSLDSIDETGRLLFTKEMKEEYTILMPQMLPIHFGLIAEAAGAGGLQGGACSPPTTGAIVDGEGLKYVHNDTCYPALLVIGQLIDAREERRV